MAKPLKLKVEYWPIAKIKAYAKNSKAHPPEQIAELRASIREFGFDTPLLLDKIGEIVAGHGRTEAAELEGYTELPIIQVKHLTAAQVIARRITDNAIPLKGPWKPDELQAELAALEDMNFDLAPLGLDNIILPDLEDIAPPAPRATKTKTTIFVSVKNADAAKAKKAISDALKKAKIEANV